MSVEELNLLISSSITFKTITPLIPVMFYFLGTQSKSQDIKDTIQNKVTFSYALFFQLFVLPLIGLTLYLVFNSSILGYDSTSNRAIIFPSWLPHWVEQNKSKNKRISIAWNMQVKCQVGEHHEFQSANL